MHIYFKRKKWTQKIKKVLRTKHAPWNDDSNAFLTNLIGPGVVELFCFKKSGQKLIGVIRPRPIPPRISGPVGPDIQPAQREKIWDIIHMKGNYKENEVFLDYNSYIYYYLILFLIQVLFNII